MLLCVVGFRGNSPRSVPRVSHGPTVSVGTRGNRNAGRHRCRPASKLLLHGDPGLLLLRSAGRFEDVGGPPGYEELLAAIRDPAHEEHDAMLEWCGGTFDPTAFDVEAVNETLRRFKL